MRQHRWLITATLMTMSELHIGGVGGHESADDTVARDGSGSLIIPGSSLAGVLRAAVAMTPGEIDRWFGPADASAASLIWVGDATEDVSQDGPRALAERTRVGIDRYSGTAHPGVLYTSEVVPPGRRFAAEIWVDCPDGIDRPPALDAVITALQHLTLGAKTGSGSGRMEVTKLQVTRHDLSTREGVLTALVGGEDVTDEQRGQEWATPPDAIEFIIPWRPVGPVMVTEAYADHDADRGPLTSSRIDEAGLRSCFLIPGSSIRGALRSHAERIVRTLTHQVVDPETPFVDQLRAGDMPALVHLFGLAGASDAESGEPIAPRRGHLEVSDCRSAGFDPRLWDEIRQEPKRSTSARVTGPTPLAQRVDLFNDKVHPSTRLWVDLVARNAIDRWTGGTKDGALFTALEVHGDSTDSWDSIRLTLRPGRDPGIGRAGAVLLTAVLRDLCDGWIPLGHGTTRGAGAIDVVCTQIRICFGDTIAREWRVEGPEMDWPRWVEALRSVEAKGDWLTALEQVEAKTKETSA